MNNLSCYLLAFAAGGSGLVFQVVWTREFTQVFGASTQAASLVLAIFLTGLSLGAKFLGRLADRTDRPLLLAVWFIVFSSAAAGVGIALILPASSLLDDLFAGTAASLPSIRVIYQAAFASLVVLPSTLLLGGIVPALTRALSLSCDDVRPGFSALFAIETCGGACSALATGFFLIASLGLHGAMWAATAISIAIAAVVACICRTVHPYNPVNAKPTCLDASPARAPMDDRRLLAAVGLAGFSVLGMEVAWTRLLLLLLGGDTYAYTIVISSFLFGLTLGGLIARWLIVRLTKPLLVYAWLQIAVAGNFLAVLAVFSWLTGGVGQRWLASLDGDWGMVVGGRFAICFGILLIPSTLAGLSFPVAASHFLRRQDHLGRRTGQFYAASACGNVLGALATGFLLIGLLGLQWSVVSLAAINLAAAACVVLPGLSPWRSAEADAFKKPKSAWLTTAFIVVGLALCGGWRWVWSVMPLGVSSGSKSHAVTFYREELAGIVAVLQNREFPEKRLMSIDGIVIGESHGGVDEKQRMLAHLPFLLRPTSAIKRVYTIGLGTGILAGELSQQSSEVEVVCVEISPAVIEGARQFADLNHNIHNHPRAKIISGDGIHYLRQHSVLFDAIVSDAKSRPGYVGNAAFYSADFYTLCRSRLAPGGLMMQWISLETPELELRTILRTFTHSFSHSCIGIATPDSLYLIGADRPLEVDMSHLQAHLAGSNSANLGEYGWRDACDVMGLLAADGETVSMWLTGDEPVNTLTWPVLEYQSLDVFQLHAKVRKQRNLAALMRLTETAPKTLQVATDEEPSLTHCFRSARLLLEATVLLGEQRVEEALARLNEGMPLASRHTQFRKLAIEVYANQAKAAGEANDTDSAIYYYRKLSQALDAENTEGHRELAVLFHQLGDIAKAADECYIALQHDSQNIELRLEFAHLLADLQKYSQSVRQFEQILESQPNCARAHLGMGFSLLLQNNKAAGRQHLTQAVKLDPSLLDEVTQAGVVLNID